MSERWACKAIGCCRMTVKYLTRADVASVRQRMRAIAQERRRYRRLHVLLKRWVM